MCISQHTYISLKFCCLIVICFISMVTSFSRDMKCFNHDIIRISPSDSVRLSINTHKLLSTSNPTFMKPLKLLCKVTIQTFASSTLYWKFTRFNRSKTCTPKLEINKNGFTSYMPQCATFSTKLYEEFTFNTHNVYITVEVDRRWDHYLDAQIAFSSKENVSPMSPGYTSTGVVLAIVLGSIFGSIFVIFIISVIVACLCCSKKRSPGTVLATGGSATGQQLGVVTASYPMGNPTINYPQNPVSTTALYTTGPYASAPQSTGTLPNDQLPPTYAALQSQDERFGQNFK